MYRADTIIDAPSGGAPSPGQPTANAVRLRPTLLGISSAHPPFEVTMQESWEHLFQHMSPQVPFAQANRRVDGGEEAPHHVGPRIRCRKSAPCSPGTGWQRMPRRSWMWPRVRSSQAIEGFDTSRVGSFVMACSTGYVNPGPDLLLAKELGLRSDLRRTFIGHMGCYAALNVIKVAMDSVAARPEELVIGNCTELSSAHVRNSPMPDEDPTESLITQALFGDASVSMLMGSAPEGAGDPVPAHAHRAAL